jgi:hypothetical protein
MIQTLFRNLSKFELKGTISRQDRLSLPTIFFDSSKFDKGGALYFHSFSVVPTSLRVVDRGILPLYLYETYCRTIGLRPVGQNNPFKHNAPPFICYRICLRRTNVAQVNPAYLFNNPGYHLCV